MNRYLKFVAAAGAGLCVVDEAYAFDLSGAWAAYPEQCHQVFTRKGRSNQIGFTNRSDQHGGGFIVEANQLRGKSARCKVKTRKEEGETVNILAGCATDIMLSNVQFSLKVLEPDKISRVFPGVMETQTSYYRCRV